MDFNSAAMRKLILLVVLTFTLACSSAQTFSEWFDQKETQIKYLKEQILALKAYGGIVNKGYKIAQHGLTAIFQSKEGDYNQHIDYLLSLLNVKQGIKDNDKVIVIFRMQSSIEKQVELVKSSATHYLNNEEKAYISKVYLNLLNQCHDLRAELNLVLRDGSLEMKDDERIKRIYKIYLEMQDCLVATQSFSKEIKLLVLNRLKERGDVEVLKSIHGLK